MSLDAQAGLMVQHVMQRGLMFKGWGLGSICWQETKTLGVMMLKPPHTVKADNFRPVFRKSIHKMKVGVAFVNSPRSRPAGV